MEDVDWELQDVDASEDCISNDILLELIPLGGHEPCGYQYARSVRFLNEGFESLTPRPMEEETASEDSKPESAFDILLKDSENLYALLGLEDLKYNASEEQIKTAYRKMVLKYHPDKMASASLKKGTDPMFLKISDAYKILSDPEKRRGYDSHYEFDEWIPEEPVPPEDFYSVYAPVFDTNSRFSMRKPCPVLGDESTPLEEVKRFYDFWRNFQSWRDFSQFDEEDADNVENRYEKRWILQENKRHRAKLKRKENQRMMTLVENAFHQDPRIQREKELLRLRKEVLDRDRQCMEEELVRSTKLNDRLRQEEEEARKQEQLSAKARCKSLRRNISLAYNSFTSAQSSENNLSTVLSEWIATLSESQLQEWDQKVQSEGCAPLQISLLETQKQKEAAMEKLKIRFEVLSSKPAKEHPKQPWSETDDSFLSKAVKQFPRWQSISSCVSNNTGRERSPDECLERADYLKRNILKQSMTDPPYMAPGLKKDSPHDTKKKSTDSSLWTPEQQQQLEKALRDYPKSMEANERWDKIGETVTGKTKKECIARFKELKSKIAKKTTDK